MKDCAQSARFCSMKKNRIPARLILFTTWLPVTLTAFSAPAITFESLLREMVDVEAIARWPQAGFTCKQASSYDRQKVAPDKPGWFSNNDNTQFIRTEDNEGRKEQVMLDVAGPGALVRFWLTAGGAKDGVLRIYLDGNEVPVIVFHAFDLLTGEMKVGAPLAQSHPGYSPNGGGNTLYLPIPYARHCKVTWQEKSSGARYYQINHRAYTPGTEVRTFALNQLDAARGLLDDVGRLLESPPDFTAGRTFSLNPSLAAGAEASLRLPAGPGAIRGLGLRLETGDASQVERTLRGIIVQLTFDGEMTAWCPATDFFGSGVGINALRSAYRTVSKDGVMRCRWVMPYATNASVTLINTGTQPVKALLKATTSEWKWDDRSMHFHTAWHHEADLKTPPVSDWNYITIHGRGVYAGDSLSLFNQVATWYGEGDEKIWVDGEAFPSHVGTGTEDYYNYSYAPKGIIQTPFSNQVRIDEPMTQGHNVMSRTRHLDGIPFHKSLQFDIELMSWKPTTLTYAATTYWYAFPGAKSNILPQPMDAAAEVPTLAQVQAQASASMPHRPGAVECESLKLIDKSDKLHVAMQDMEAFGAGVWSGGNQLLAEAGQVGDFVELEVPATDSAAKRVTLYLTQASDYGTLRFCVNGRPCAMVFDGFAPKVQLAPALTLGAFQPQNGRFIVRAEVTGSNPLATGPKYFFGLDCFSLEPAH